MKQLYLPLFLTFLIALSCGRDRELTQDPVKRAPSSNDKRVNLVLFAGGNCHPCREELPVLKNKLNEFSPEKRARINVVVYVVQNATGGGNVNQAYADSFGAELGLDFKMVADRFGKIFYQNYPPGSGVPATMVTLENGETYKKYEPGTPKLEHIDELVSLIDGALN